MKTVTVATIEDDGDLKRALARFEAIMFAEAGTPEHAEMEVLGLLIEDYEKKNHPIHPPTPIEAIRFAMRQRGLKPVDLIPIIGGGRGRVYQVLSGQRRLTLPMIRNLIRELKIPAEALIGSSEAA